jgi:geranylgeranyl diphosphate synthase type I
VATTNRVGLIQAAREAAPGLDTQIEKFLSDVDRQLRPHLKRALAHVPAIEPLKKGMTYQMMSGGKRIRAALAICSCNLVGGDYRSALDFAAAIEHLHNFTLIHDDIADGDTERRSQESVWKRFGVPHAVNMGDLFVGLASLAIVDAPYPDGTRLALLNLIARYGLEMAEGQTLDINMREAERVTIPEYLNCTNKKTGAFLAMATVGGGILGSGSEEQLQSLRDFAILAGTAFQMKDDVLDIDGSKGRGSGSDVREGKRTLLAIYAAEKASEVQRRELFRILNKSRDTTTAQEIEWVFALYTRTGAREYVERTAARTVDQACRHLARFPDSEAKTLVFKLSKYLSRRAH